MPFDPLIEEAGKMDSRVRKLARDPFADLPTFHADHVSQVHPDISGPVELRYPTMGDMLSIERLVQHGKPYSEVLSTLQVLIERAPATWYKPGENGGKPVLTMTRLPYDTGLVQLYVAFCLWRDSFRHGGVEEPIEAPE